ncbi:GNAT family N-acetyltransferase [Caldalkalibacillus mannanilyticus]|uniref:GNAT family N-acetyltransferase n=1 Tax=Caldalkalibacillus mannanilyticus TaxID=1418 RepID=UPI000468E21F|nr:GNAT family N-acetyltransferase [Caldalkalibacillus mannanilyticus]
MIIREIREEDAENYLEFNNRLLAETDFLLYESGERSMSVEEQKERINRLLSSERSMILIAEDNDNIIGHIGAIGGTARRNRHSLYIIVGIRKQYHGRGVGTRLFEELENWAKEKDFHRLELTVMAHNEAAISLYRKRGFEVEGTKKHSLLVKGTYIDELYMSKLI